MLFQYHSNELLMSKWCYLLSVKKDTVYRKLRFSITNCVSKQKTIWQYLTVCSVLKPQREFSCNWHPLQLLFSTTLYPHTQTGYVECTQKLYLSCTHDHKLHQITTTDAKDRPWFSRLKRGEAHDCTSGVCLSVSLSACRRSITSKTLNE